MSEGLTASFAVRRPGGFALQADISIESGQTAVLLGPNGAGKSTAVAALAGLAPIDSGRIALDSEVLDDTDGGVFVPPEERRVGVVFQDYLLFPKLSVIENVAFGLRSRGMTHAVARSRSRVWLERLGLDGLDERRPGELSGGQAQRVALARALVTEPGLLLLDEPLAALDVTIRTEMRRLLVQHLEEFPGPRLLITHDPTEAFLVADRIHIIEDGRITQTGDADEIRLRPKTRYAADLAGSNLLTGVAGPRGIEVGPMVVQMAEEQIEGPVIATIHPNSITVHNRRPEGSQRNTWETEVVLVERLGSRVRLRTGTPLPLTVEITESARVDLGIEPGARVWVAFKATELSVQPGSMPD